MSTQGREQPLRQVSDAAIPFAARILAADDVYQVLTEQRPHRPAQQPKAAARRLETGVAQGRLDGQACARFSRPRATRCDLLDESTHLA